MFSADDERQSVESILGTGFYDHQLLGMGISTPYPAHQFGGAVR
jgi:hypothetical protein